MRSSKSIDAPRRPSVEQGARRPSGDHAGSEQVSRRSSGDRVVMSGSLWKERSHWLNKMGNPMGNLYRYRLRFFALSHGQAGGNGPELRSWKDETRYRHKEAPDKVIYLAGCSLSCAYKHTGQTETFGLFHPERREVFLLCPDRTQYLHWMEALEGTLINPQALKLCDFSIVTMVGKGSFGQVFQVRKKDTNQVFALKVLDKSHLRKIDQVMSTKQERRVLEIVNHPFIVKLHYAFQTGPALCLVMDFINGGELFMHLRKHRSFSESDARIWAAQILLALEYLHSMGIIYRDIKPENVLLDREGHIKLTDFGLARDATDMSTATEVAGSPYYMAPEVLLMQGHDVQADWWSLGILIYEMITGLPPFYSKDTKAAYHRLMSEPLEFKEHVSVQARELITGLLNTDPAKRLGAVDRGKGAAQMVSEGWGDGMPIKTHAWFNGLRWDAVLLRQVQPSLIPHLTDAMDVSNFDEVFTSDNSWKYSSLLSTAASKSLAEDPFSDFHYVSRPQCDRIGGHCGAPGSQVSGHRPGGSMRYLSAEVREKGRMTLDAYRNSSERSSLDMHKRNSGGSNSLDMGTPGRTSQELRKGGSVDLSPPLHAASRPYNNDEDLIACGRDSSDKPSASDMRPCAPWHPCENGCTQSSKNKRERRYSNASAGPPSFSGTFDRRGSADDERVEGMGSDHEEHSSAEEDSRAHSNTHHSSHVSKSKLRAYCCNIPVAKEGWLESAKKGSAASTVYMKKRFVSSKRKYMRLIPSLGCLVVFNSETSLMPSKVIPVPNAHKIYPKHAIVHIGSKVHVYSIRLLVAEKEYTFVCQSELERDEWVEQLRTVGEHWKDTCMPHLQLRAVVKTWKHNGLFKKLAKMTSFSEAKDKFMWEAVTFGGDTVQMVSINGSDKEGAYRYDGMVLRPAPDSTQVMRHGRGVCRWKLSAEEREADKVLFGPPKPRKDIRHLYFDGIWDMDRRSGLGMIMYCDDSVFEGTYKKGIGAEGYGRMAYANGSWYEGYWHKGKKHGYGYMWWAASNEAHTGYFDSDLPHGHGTRYYPNGQVYRGGWQWGEKHGVGLVESLAAPELDQLPDELGEEGGKTCGAVGGNSAARRGGEGHACPLRRVKSHSQFHLAVTTESDDEEGGAGSGSRSREGSRSGGSGLGSRSREGSRSGFHIEARGHESPLVPLGEHDTGSCSDKGASSVVKESWREASADVWTRIESEDMQVHNRSCVRRCINGVPLDELAEQFGALGPRAQSVDEEERMCEADMEWQALRRYDQDMTDAYTEFYVAKGSETSSHTHTLHRAPSLERKNSFKASSKGQLGSMQSLASMGGIQSLTELARQDSSGAMTPRSCEDLDRSIHVVRSASSPLPPSQAIA